MGNLALDTLVRLARFLTGDSQQISLRVVTRRSLSQGD